MEPIKIQVANTESFVPNVPTRALTFLGIMASEVPAVPVNAAGAVYDHIKTSPSIKAAGARIISAEGAVINGTVNTVKGAAGIVTSGGKAVYARATSDDAKASRMIAADKAKSFFGGIGKKLGEVAPIKVVVEGAKEVKDGVVDTWNATGQETVITTTETIVLDELTSGEMYNVYNPHLFCDRKGLMVCGSHPTCVMGTPDCERCNNLSEITCEICSSEGTCEARALQIMALQHFGQSEPEKSEPSCDEINEARHAG